jgi:hypothetical protein
MAEQIFYWLLALNLIAGFWFVYGIVTTELCQGKKRRTTAHTKCTRPETPQHQSPFTSNVDTILPNSSMMMRFWRRTTAT